MDAFAPSHDYAAGYYKWGSTSRFAHARIHNERSVRGRSRSRERLLFAARPSRRQHPWGEVIESTQPFRKELTLSHQISPPPVHTWTQEQREEYLLGTSIYILKQLGPIEPYTHHWTVGVSKAGWAPLTGAAQLLLQGDVYIRWNEFGHHWRFSAPHEQLDEALDCRGEEVRKLPPIQTWTHEQRENYLVGKTIYTLQRLGPIEPYTHYRITGVSKSGWVPFTGAAQLLLDGDIHIQWKKFDIQWLFSSPCEPPAWAVDSLTKEGGVRKPPPVHTWTPEQRKEYLVGKSIYTLQKLGPIEPDTHYMILGVSKAGWDPLTGGAQLLLEGDVYIRWNEFGHHWRFPSAREPLDRPVDCLKKEEEEVRKPPPVHTWSPEQREKYLVGKSIYTLQKLGPIEPDTHYMITGVSKAGWSPLTGGAQLSLEGDGYIRWMEFGHHWRFSVSCLEEAVDCLEEEVMELPPVHTWTLEQREEYLVGKSIYALQKLGPIEPDTNYLITGVSKAGWDPLTGGAQLRLAGDLYIRWNEFGHHWRFSAPCPDKAVDCLEEEVMELPPIQTWTPEQRENYLVGKSIYTLQKLGPIEPYTHYLIIGVSKSGWDPFTGAAQLLLEGDIYIQWKKFDIQWRFSSPRERPYVDAGAMMNIYLAG